MTFSYAISALSFEIGFGSTDIAELNMDSLLSCVMLTL